MRMCLFNLFNLAVLASAQQQWQDVNLGNVYSDGYHQETVWRAADTTSSAACKAFCAELSNCTSYDWCSGDAKATSKCAYDKQCWLRNDTFWGPKQQGKCNKVAGRKVGPTPPTPPTPSPAPPAPAPVGSKNVLFVIFDDLRVLHGAWGQEQPNGPWTPNTDGLAKKSLIFDRAYCNQAVCGPSRASLVSGRRPDSTEMWNFVGGFRKTPGADKWNTWPEYFKKRGYYTKGCGKIFHPVCLVFARFTARPRLRPIDADAVTGRPGGLRPAELDRQRLQRLLRPGQVPRRHEGVARLPSARGAQLHRLPRLQGKGDCRRLQAIAGDCR
jgi:hypothetical protein